ncbi:hypothetical protein INT08_00635 [Prosthecochloris sp. N3]|uniref:Uncharacterized protein n=1 Tax=Prosthecochloris ethylica TaxID=2743976 RepID=A0ABR9XP92_9CHLB|nr:hypothetical protein [Prosthecochloris ethylica]MBF0585777.1 hypothetical protein [Prosthecochloris ethylica]MBF0635687.1 hypothetical protein [Prosthecochloris ethylica]NUK46986.1 hypothetical protein [Prosthecochloris ethylica]
MGNISTYVSGHTDLKDISEFFQKQLLQAGERPIAFFDGVFYESHQERVGNIVYQDYLVYSDRAVYLWARGATKDYLDRFPLGAVSINSRNKDSDFATLNLRIRRENKEPVYVIFDMVEIEEADRISTLHTVIESTIENYLGSNFRQEVPDDIAAMIFESAVSVCPPRSLSVQPPASSAPNSPIGYGQDLLEQYKASTGYGSSQGGPAGSSGQAGHGRSQVAQDALNNLEGMLPSDPEALKRIAANLKDMVGEAPFKFRDQVMKDLQHVPNDVATVLKAANELISNIADNPQAEKFVMNAIQTAVKNDGIIGSFGKLLKMGSSFGPMGKKPSSGPGGRSGSQETQGSGADRSADPSAAGEGGIRRKKIRIQTDDAPPSGRGTAGTGPQSEASIDSPDDSGIKRKKISVKVDDSVSSPLTTGPEPELDDVVPPAAHAKKLSVRVEESASGPDIDENAIADALKEAEEKVQEEQSPVGKKISVRVAGEEKPSGTTSSKENVYRTIESETSDSKLQHEKTSPDAGGDEQASPKTKVNKLKSSQ